MTSLEKYEYWKDYAEQDLDAAQAMFDTGRWFYVVFMCQQAVEKIVKGVYTLYVNVNVPRTHNISLLANHIEDSSSVVFSEERYKLFQTLSKYYLSNRYPDFISVVGELVDKEEATDILAKTKEAFAWLLTLKQSKD